MFFFPSFLISFCGNAPRPKKHLFVLLVNNNIMSTQELVNTDPKDTKEQSKKEHSFSRSDKLVIALILLLIFISTASANMLIPSYGQIIDDFGIDSSKIYLPDSIAVMVEACVMVVWGYYTDRIDRNKVIHGGVFLSTLGFVLTSFCTSYNQLMAARVLSGAGLGFSIPVGFSILMDIVPAKQRSGWFGFLAIFSSIVMEPVKR